MKPVITRDIVFSIGFLKRHALIMADESGSQENEEEVKSNSLIKFERTSPRQFATLPAAVDLKRPPSNW